jgi:prolyl 4-hydroxylase
MALLANGTGGPRNWQAAIRLLREHAEKDPDSARELAIVQGMDLDEQGLPRTPAAGEVLSTEPAVWRFPNLLSNEECEYLVSRAAPLLRPSVIIDPATGQARPHPVRTSDGAMFPWVDETPAIHAINQRLAAASGRAACNGEPLQILRYAQGQEYRPHHDALPNTKNNRVLTFLLYLNDGYAGGETEFCIPGLVVKGSCGQGLLFRNIKEDGQPDRLALHAGRPVTSGVKLLATRWIREEPFLPN